jgi:GPI mannosyltransferase 2
VIMLPWSRNLLRQPQNTPVSTLTVFFLAWKFLLLTVAFLAPGPSYDSSTELLFQSQGLSGTPQLNPNEESWGFERLARRLTRWDAIYFTTIGCRGRVFEQEWAFGWGWTQLLAELNQSKQAA